MPSSFLKILIQSSSFDSAACIRNERRNSHSSIYDRSMSTEMLSQSRPTASILPNKNRQNHLRISREPWDSLADQLKAESLTKAQLSIQSTAAILWDENISFFAPLNGRELTLKANTQQTMSRTVQLGSMASLPLAFFPCAYEQGGSLRLCFRCIIDAMSSTT